MRAIVVGGDGKLGRALCARLLELGHDITRTTRRIGPLPRGRPGEELAYLDLLDPVLPRGKASALFIMGGIPGFVPASSNPDAWRVNAEAPVLLAMQARSRDIAAIHLSSGAVERAQETAYGRQKAHADLGVLLCGGCVVRLMPVVSPDKYVDVADLLIDAASRRLQGMLIRWEG